MGTTGARDAVGSQAAGLVGRVREYTSLPVAVGLGRPRRRQAAQVAGFADGVIVGSAFVQRLLAAPDERGAGLAARRGSWPPSWPPGSAARARPDADASARRPDGRL